ncbi:hypothetical protein BD779DRAFT_1535947, partial [Infundibulicybe gibba]
IGMENRCRDIYYSTLLSSCLPTPFRYRVVILPALLNFLNGCAASATLIVSAGQSQYYVTDPTTSNTDLTISLPLGRVELILRRP